MLLPEKGDTNGLATDEQEGTGHRFDGGNRLRHRLASRSGGGVGRGERSLAAAGRGGLAAPPNGEEKRPSDGCSGRPRPEGRVGPSDPRRAGGGHSGAPTPAASAHTLCR